MPARFLPRSRWGWALLAITLAGLTVRVVFVLGWHLHDGQHIGGDSYYYHYGANLLADGKGFIQPYDYRIRGWTVQAAEHPPLYIGYLAMTSFLGMSSYLTHQLWSCLLGMSTIVIMGFAGKRVIGARAGLVAAGLTAIYPNFWLNDATVMSETMAEAIAALVILVAYVFWQRRDMKSALGLGAVVALAALSRAEAVALVVLMVLPLALVLKSLPVRRRLVLFVASGAATAAVLAPWVGYNLTRFDHPVTISSGLDPTLLSANCDETWYGEFRGWWSMRCITGTQRVYQDLSSQGILYRRQALDYIKAHQSDLPGVILAREGRTWGLYRPWQTPQFDWVEDRPQSLSWVGLVMLWGLEAAAIGGGVVLYRRRTTIIPLVAPLVVVTFSTAMTFGQTRYRAPAEPALVLLAVAGVDGLVHRLRRPRGAEVADTQPPPEPRATPRERVGV